MKPTQPLLTADASGEIAALIEALHDNAQRLEELTAGEVDTVADSAGRTFLLRAAQDHLRHNEAAKQAAIVNALPAHIALLDARGTIISVNKAWRVFARANALTGPEYGTGVNYLEVCDSAQGNEAAEARQAAAGIRAVLSGEQSSFSMEYPCHAPTEQRWFLMTVTPMADARLNGAVVMHLNITEKRRGEDALRRFGAAMDAIADGLFLTDRSTMSYIYVNEAACRQQNLTREELLALGPMRLLAKSRAEVERDYDAVIDSGAAEEPVEVLWSRPDGSPLWVELRRHAQWSGERWTIITLVRDITERKKADDRIVYLNRVYAVLSGINTLIVRVHDRDELFREACRIAVEAGGFHMALIGMVDRSTLKIVPVASMGKDDDLLQAVTAMLSSTEDGSNSMLARAVREKTAVVANDAKSDSRVLLNKRYYASKVRSMAVFPLTVLGEVIGVFALYAHEIEFFHDEELQLFNELAGDIAFAIDHIGKQERLDYLAYYDPLTGLPNRTLIHDRLTQLLQAARREEGEPDLVVVALINIERFKSINDSFGRHRGDVLLKAVAVRLGATLGATDHLARIGSDHFAAILSGLDEAEDVAHFLDEQLLPDLARPFEIDAEELHIAVNVGVALFPSDGDDADTLFANAETALHKAATAGERYMFYAPQMNARVSQKLTLENKLRRALERQEFVLHYQPKVNLQNGEVVGLEALIRWQDPAGGLVTPVEFIPILEETGMIVDIGRWALEQAIADYFAWHTDGLQPPRVAVNVSAVQLRRKDFLEMLETVLAQRGGEHNYLDLELTEALLIADIEANVRCLRAVRAMGVKIAVDDFGTGYSSLSYLKRFPIDYLKIDQSFVRDITTAPDAAAICIAIIGLAHNLKLKVIAEGVETEGQMNYLRNHGCDEMQGYLFSRAVPADQCAQLLKERKKLALPPAATDERQSLLIVDDEPGILSSLKRLLRRDGYELFTAGSAREGFDVLASHPVQVIISDQRMPEMSGTEFLSRVRELYPDTIRIVLSGYTDLETVIGAVNRGAIYRFLTKPWEDDQLREHIREAFRHQKAAQHKS